MDPTLLPSELLYLIIRFTAAIPDLPLSVPISTTSAPSLKLLIREHLPDEHRKSRLRLIYSGRVLDGNTAIAATLGVKTSDRGGRGRIDVKGKGKTRAGEEQRTYYIHCAVGDVLSPDDIDKEARAAREAEEALLQQLASQRSPLDSPTAEAGESSSVRSTTRAPRGFDRLLTSGFTGQEVASLRTQFVSILSYTHTPDSLPTGDALLALEDRWLDSEAGSGNSPLGTGQGGEQDGWGEHFTADEYGLDDIFFGVAMGFFWPLGCLVWGAREEGVWTMRRRMAVYMGAIVGVGFGFVRMSG